MYVTKTDGMKVPLKVWHKQGEIESQCIRQMTNVASLPFAFKHISLMPDGHLGIGASIGSVAPIKGYVIPSIVGVDIGCGMCALKTNIKNYDTEILKKVMGEVRQVVPVGFSKQKVKQDNSKIPVLPTKYRLPIIEREIDNALFSVGSLGGGNHFCEFQKDIDNNLWVMIHSGSRNLGKQVADFYNKVAITLNERYFSSVPSEWELAFLPVDSVEGVNYQCEMNYCIEFALANRKLMIENVQKVLSNNFKDIVFDDIINIPHNYARMENHFGENVMIHRKGATSAKLNEIGIIPGSQGTKSYIVKGKGNRESFESCSHGAGRKMGRKQAQKTLDFEKEKAFLDAQGIIHAVRSIDDLDESTGSYKSIDIVMEEQKDLVDIMVELKPLGVIKG